VLWRCWLGSRKGIRPVKNWVVGSWRGYLSGVRCRLAYGPADATATYCLLLASVKSRSVLPFWYRITLVVPDIGPLNGCVCNMLIYSYVLQCFDTVDLTTGRASIQLLSKLFVLFSGCILWIRCNLQWCWKSSLSRARSILYMCLYSANSCVFVIFRRIDRRLYLHVQSVIRRKQILHENEFYEHTTQGLLHFLWHFSVFYLIICRVLW